MKFYFCPKKFQIENVSNDVIVFSDNSLSITIKLSSHFVYSFENSMFMLLRNMKFNFTSIIKNAFIILIYFVFIRSLFSNACITLRTNNNNYVHKTEKGVYQ